MPDPHDERGHAEAQDAEVRLLREEERARRKRRGVGCEAEGGLQDVEEEEREVERGGEEESSVEAEAEAVGGNVRQEQRARDHLPHPRDAQVGVALGEEEQRGRG
eukprot:3390854-Rhodomonas_salina.2